MPHDILQWSISPVLQDIYGEDSQGKDVIVGQKIYAAVVPIINGDAIETGWVFDTVAMLTRQDPGYYLFDLFTCSCGVAGCAGIADEIHLRVGENEVQLQIPRVEPFIKRFVPKYFPNADSPLVWTFDAQAYRLSLASLVAQIQALEANSPGVPVCLLPEDGGYIKEPLESVGTQVDNAKKWYKKRAEEIAQNWAYFGPLYQATMAIDIEGTSYNLSVSELFEAVANTVFGVQSENEIDTDASRANWLYEKIVYFREHPQELVALSKSLSWESFQKNGYLYHANGANLILQLRNNWPNVPMRFVPMEKPEEQDWTLL